MRWKVFYLNNTFLLFVFWVWPFIKQYFCHGGLQENQYKNVAKGR